MERGGERQHVLGVAAVGVEFVVDREIAERLMQDEGARFPQQAGVRSAAMSNRAST